MGVDMTKILLVEDDKSLREIYGVRLLAEGYQIASAGDGEEALAMAVKEKPDLIIADVMMPKISGFDMLDILRSTPETKDIKVIMMTALSSEDQRARGESLGANRYLVKSQVGIEDVVRTVHDVLADSPVAATPAIPQFGAPAPSAVTTTAQPTPAAKTAEPSAFTPQPTTMAPQAAAAQMPAQTPPTMMSTHTEQQPISVQPTAPTQAPISSPQPTQMPVTPVQPIPAPVVTPTAAQTPPTPVQPMVTPVSPVPTPTMPAAPTPQPTPMPTTAPVPTPIPPSQLPQPTAPFSTPSPVPLGDRTINPTVASSPMPDIANLITQELNGSSMTPPPTTPAQ